jgi:hypothetical protein
MEDAGCTTTSHAATPPQRFKPQSCSFFAAVPY